MITLEYTQQKPPPGTMVSPSSPYRIGLDGAWLLNSLQDSSHHFNTLANTGTLFGNGNFADMGLKSISTSTYCSCPTVAETGALSIVGWLYSADITNEPTLLINQDLVAFATYQYDLHVVTSGELAFGVALDASNNKAWFSPAGSIVINKWYQIGVSHDGTLADGGVSLYINGVLQTATISTNGTPSIPTSGLGPSQIGGGGPASANIANIVDHCFLWNRALSAGDFANLYADPFQMFQEPHIEFFFSTFVPGYVPPYTPQHKAVMSM